MGRQEATTMAAATEGKGGGGALVLRRIVLALLVAALMAATMAAMAMPAFAACRGGCANGSPEPNDHANNRGTAMAYSQTDGNRPCSVYC